MARTTWFYAVGIHISQVGPLWEFAVDGERSFRQYPSRDEAVEAALKEATANLTRAMSR